jgi:cell division protein FtsW
MNMVIERHQDKILMFSSITLMMLGIIFIYSASGPFSGFMTPPKPTWHFLMKQSLWAIVALTTMYIAYRFDYELLVKISPFMIFVAIVLLVAVFPLSSRGIQRWINFGGLTIQPSEFFKIAAIIFIARVMAKRAGRQKMNKRFIPALGVVLLGVLLILMEPDLGTAALILAVTISLLYISGFPKRYLIMLILAGIMMASVLVFGLEYEKDRVDSYLVTLKDPFAADASYQTRQSLVSLGSGGLVGKGLANGGQKHLFLPARHTDFILSAAAEEGGFLIVVVIFSLFGLIAWSGGKIATAAVDIEGSLLAWGMVFFLILQGTINVGVALGLFPITGITLPFLSYGGSSLVACSAAIGITASVWRRGKSPRRYFKRFKA